ncbi:MAG: endonuclease/exonuclease/phosphatase family protein [Polyangiaceae bacterium]|nr:endonuclease/exonuclease/phosphatase family protein [Polyangiaceae bacterium]
MVTLNIWNRLGPWEERLAVIRKGIQELSPDIVGLQEVIELPDSTQAKMIADGLGYETAYGMATSYGGGVTMGNAVLSRWPVVSERVFRLPNGGTDEHRSILFTEIDSPFGKLPFFVTHLNWKLHESVVREEQVQEVAAVVKAHAPVEGLPPILVGDLNAQPEASEIRFLKGLQSLGQKSTYFADCFEQAGYGPGVTFDGTRNLFAEQYHEHPRRIDYILVRGPDTKARGKPLTSRVVFDIPDNGVFASDHFGVMAEISI